MNDLRALLAIALFSISSYLVYDLFVQGFNWQVLIAVIVGYILVHFMWPRNSSADSAWYDILEIIIDLPYRTIAALLRGISRGIRGTDGDIGIDL